MKPTGIYFKIILLLTIILVFSGYAMGQPPPPTPEAIPIDGGLGLLIAGGIAYAAHKLYKERDEETEMQ